MNSRPHVCERTCACDKKSHETGLIVVTGGPGAGKTAILEMARKNFCQHVAVLPEAASIVFGGGFWRLESPHAKKAAQRAIFHVQKEMEELITGDGRWALGLCDRGTIDGLAYWPGTVDQFWTQVGGSIEEELARYQAVIHLHTPTRTLGYNHKNELRVETPEEAREIDDRIRAIWSVHPRYVEVQSSADFLAKANLAIKAISAQIPSCCQLED